MRAQFCRRVIAVSLGAVLAVGIVAPLEATAAPAAEQERQICGRNGTGEEPTLHRIAADADEFVPCVFNTRCGGDLCCDGFAAKGESCEQAHSGCVHCRRQILKTLNPSRFFRNGLRI